MKRIGYYPGCSMPGTAREYDESLRAIAPAIGIDLVEVPDWNCCGATAAHNLNRELSLSLPARILALAGQAGLTEVLVPCAACFNRLTMVRHELAHDEELRARIADIIELPYAGTVRPVNMLEALVPVRDEIAAKMKTPFAYAAASYYGCLMVRPPKVINFDRAEDPVIMDQLLAAIGARPVVWAFKTECCGAGFSVSRSDLVGSLSAKIVKDAVKRGADAIIVACPMCHANLDMRRTLINRAAGERYDIPVLYITQAIGLALGIDRKKLGLQRHLVPVKLPAVPTAAPEATTAANPAAAAAATPEE